MNFLVKIFIKKIKESKILKIKSDENEKQDKKKQQLKKSDMKKKSQLEKNYDEAVVSGYKGSFENFKVLMEKEEVVDFSEGLKGVVKYDYFLKVAKKFVEGMERQRGIIATLKRLIKEAKEERGETDVIFYFDKLKKQEIYDKGQELAERFLKMLHYFDIHDNSAKISILREVYKYSKKCVSRAEEDLTDEEGREYLRFNEAYQLGVRDGEELAKSGINQKPWVNPDPELEDEYERAEREEKEQDDLDELTFNDEIEEVGEKK